LDELYDSPGRYSDIDIKIGPVVFPCHKLILAMKSPYFQQHLYPAESRVPIHQLVIDGILPDDFKSILRYVYRGEVQLESTTVGRVLRAANKLRMEELTRICKRFLADTLDVGLCVPYWKIATRLQLAELEIECRELFVREFVRVTKASRLQEITHDMMKAAVERDELGIKREVDLCEVLLKWLDSRSGQTSGVSLLPLVSNVRWSGVSAEYIKLKMINNDLVTKDRQCSKYLSSVLSYRLGGIQFPGLRTHHRPSTGLETSVVIFGVSDGRRLSPDSSRVSLQLSRRVARIPGVPTVMQREVTACTNGSSAFVTGVGSGYSETWRWDSVGGWARCADMVEGRRRHCAAFVNTASMYALGGYVDATKKTMSSVEQFNTLKNTWTTVGELTHCVRHAGCAAYKTSVYLFGGVGLDESTQKDKYLDDIQEYDTMTEQCTVLTQRLPQPTYLLRTVLWDTSVVVMNNITCLIFDLDRLTVQHRDQFAAGVAHSGLVLDDQKLFVIGGGKSQVDGNGKSTWKCTDEVKCVAVTDVINDRQTADWTPYAKLPTPCFVQAYCVLSIAAAS